MFNFLKSDATYTFLAGFVIGTIMIFSLQPGDAHAHGAQPVSVEQSPVTE